MVYINRVTRGAKDGSTPCQVKHIFLSNDERTALQKGLIPFVQDSSRSGIGDVLRDSKVFPAHILRELEAVKEETDLRTVFVLHNLPEVDRSTLPVEGEASKLKQWVTKNTYAARFVEGVFEFFGTHMNIGVILRRSDDHVVGSRLHRDNKPFAGFSAVHSDGAATRITDFAAVMAEAKKDFRLQNIRLDTSDRHNLSLDDFDKAFPDWEKTGGGIQLKLSASQSSETAQAFEEVVARNSVELVMEPGSVAFWSNRGRIFHQALPAHNELALTAGHYRRIALAATARGDVTIS